MREDLAKTSHEVRFLCSNEVRTTGGARSRCIIYAKAAIARILQSHVDLCERGKRCNSTRSIDASKSRSAYCAQLFGVSEKSSAHFSHVLTKACI